ncbi:SusC/RagA family TonB-linked outer membrane protein [Chryseobacterium sp. 22543]|uniref:SusC/RagA family TonB-linked outer membrane protein n=1 Tax=Chryseobacterium sp. 22543 TaxID=3453940 RepID=UPI003F840385
MSRSQYRIAVIAIVCFIMAGPTLAFQKKEAISTKLVSLSFINVELREIFQSMQKQTGLTFFYSNNLLNVDEKRTIKVNNVSIEQALSLLLDSKKYSWRLDESGKFIKISSRGNPISSRPVVTEHKDTLDPTILRGRITDSKGEPLPGATVKLKGSNMGTTSDASGNFTLSNLPPQSIIQVSFTGYYNKEIPTNGNSQIQVTLATDPNELKEVEIVSTGYQKIPKERATGSFTYIDNKLLNRSVSTDVLSRLDGVTSGTIFNKQAGRIGGDPNNGGDPSISIRGRSTLFANTQPLIILDNFPYEGDPANINPNDIESISILKDAAAASIWGVRAGNGVIVLTSKKGKLSQKPTLELNSNITITDKPNIYAVPQIDSKDYINLEKYYFNNGRYDVFLTYLPYFVQSPIVDILDKQKRGLITPKDAEDQLSALSQVDNRNAYSKYFFQRGLNQQHSLSITGGSLNDRYYISGGFDRNIASQIPNDYNRFTINARNTHTLFNDRLAITTDIFFIKSKTETSPNSYLPAFPYEKIIDQNGKALPVIRDWRQASKDNFANSGILDWNYYPLNERLDRGNKTNLTDYRIDLGINYKIYHDVLSLGLNYLYQQGTIVQDITTDKNSYATRSLINLYSRIDSNGQVIRPIPLGNMYNRTSTDYKSNTGRIQLNYHQQVSRMSEITAIGGFELREYNSFAITNNLYGYNTDNATNIPVDYFTDFPTLIGGGIQKIPNIYGQTGITDRFISYFLNAAYTYNEKYTLSVSGRRDESNLFGVDANQKGVPLYSFGASWNVSKESFYKNILPVLPYLRLRITDGYNGNLSKNLSAYTTAQTARINRFDAPQQAIINPPNPHLTWEKIHNINAALDFGFKNNTVSGSIDYYVKTGTNLIGNSPMSPQTGIGLFTGNTAQIRTKGIDLVLNSINIQGSFQWTTNLLFNYVKDKILDYKLQTGVNSYYAEQNYSNPIVGKPYSALFAFKWAGLDSAGNPQGFLNGKVSEDYGGILNSTNLNELIYKGTTSPKLFGSIRNNFAYRGIELSINISYKIGYYFRRGSFNSSSLAYQQADYTKRWQQPGDEKITSVPALQYPADSRRDQFYDDSEILVEKGDHIRLQDIQLAYTFPRSNHKLPFTNLRIYGYANNIGILWRANKLGLDPDYTGKGGYAIPNPRSYSLGIKADF